jgi:CHAT domain-containing protein/tetratricopeptide (TPR) repeat protein
MQKLVALAALTLIACRARPESLDRELLQGQQWLQTEQFGLVLSHVDEWIRSAGQGENPKFQWRFRLLKANALLGKASASSEVLTLLTRGEMPVGADMAGDRAEWFILQARAMYSLDRDAEVPLLLDKASDEASRAGRLDLAAEIELRRGFLLSDEGKFSEAHLTYNRILAYARQSQDRYLEARVEDSLGLLLQSESRHDEAIPELERSRSIAREIGASDTAARAEGNLGYSYYRLGDYDNASASYETAEKEFSRNDNQNEVQIWIGNAGNLYFDAHDYPAAAAAYTRAAQIAHRVGAKVWEARWLSNLASTAIEREEWEQAEAYYKDARALKDKLADPGNEANSFNNAARIAAGRGHFDDARDLFQKALARNAEDPTVALEAHTGLAGIYSRLLRPHDAEAEFRKTVAEIDRRQSRMVKDDYRLSWLQSLVRFYQQYVDFLMSGKQPDRALEAAESSRSKVLTGQPVRQLTASGYRQLARQTGAVLLEYWLSPNHSYLWVITPEKVVLHMLPPKGEILPLIRSYRAVVTGGRNPLDVASDTGLKLYNALLAPAMADAGGATQFIIVPDDELYSLNFETLPDGNNLNRFWIDRATVRISPSLNYLASHAPRATGRTAPRLLLIGDPVQSLPQYPHLEYASKEIDAVAATMAADHPLIVRGAAATPDAYVGSKPGDFTFIHFSAHAAAAAKRASALDSSVILSGPPDKCRLVARDVLSVPLNAELVTVSACRSAGGKTYGGEGLVGFAWAFMKAGAGNVIAGLWDVNDRSTVQLMTGLYSRIAAGAPAAEALRSSKLALIHGGGSYAKPFYWAPFELYTARVN